MIRNTPLLRLEDTLRVFVKSEILQPSCSVKLRAANYMVKDALQEVRYHDKTILESSSGNLGVAVAYMCQQFGVPCTIVLPETTRHNVIKQTRHFNAKVIQTSREEGSDGSKLIAQGMAEEYPERYHYLDQYSNQMNVLAHQEQTGPEIWRQTEGKVTHFVTGVGTGGTITGVGKYLKAMNPAIKVIGVQPDEWFGISGLRRLEDSFVPDVYNHSFVDDTIFVNAEDTVRLYASSKYYGGLSTMANIIACMSLPLDINNLIVTMMPDGRVY